MAKDYYDAGYFSGGRDDGYVDYIGAAKTLRREFRPLVNYLHRVTGGGRLLELGCAYGYFLIEAAARFEVTGIEISTAAAAACNDAGLHVINDAVTQESLAGLGEFDIIVMLDVIEHLPDPRDTIRLCSLHLRKGGILIITTGDFGSTAARLAGKRWRLMTPPQHLWFFTVESVRRLAGGHGFVVESIRHPSKKVPLPLIVYQVKRMTGLRRLPGRVPEIGVPVNLFDAMRIVLRKS